MRDGSISKTYLVREEPSLDRIRDIVTDALSKEPSPRSRAQLYNALHKIKQELEKNDKS